MALFPKHPALLLAASLACPALLSGDSPLKDGVHKGSAKGYRGPIEVEVAVKDGQIAEVRILKHKEDRPKTALVDIPKRIVSAQRAAVDAVTGATFTSKGICKAVETALAPKAADTDKQKGWK